MNLVFPGSFDPVTLGHVDIIKRGAQMADTLYVAVLDNADKQYLIPKEDRIRLIEEALKNISNVVVDGATGMTVDYCKRVGAGHILRGIRNVVDYQYEMDVAANNKLFGGIETVFLASDPKHTNISASYVRGFIRTGVDLEHFVPQCVIDWVTDTNK